MLLLVACSPAATWQGTIEERGEVTYVSNPRDGLWQDRDPAPIRFELEQTFGAEIGPENEVIGSTGYRNVAVDAAGNVYIYDYTAAQLISFSPDGAFRWRVGGAGQGPGAFFDAQGVAWDGASGIYVTNAGGQRLDEWTTDGEFVAAHLLPERDLPSGTALGFLDDGTLIMQDRLRRQNGLSRAGGVLGLLNMSASPLTRVGEREVDVGDSELRFSGFFISMNTGEDYISVGDFDSYELRIFDRRGALQRVIARDFREMVGYPIADDRSSPYSSLSAPLRLSSGHWVASARWIDVADPAADYARRKAAPGPLFGDSPFVISLDVFDPDGRFLYTFRDDPEDPIGYLERVDSDGKLYTSVSDPFPHVRRYRVEIDESSATAGRPAVREEGQVLPGMDPVEPLIDAR